MRLAQGDPTRLPALAAELVRENPDLLYCAMGPEARACHEATQAIPIVFTQAGDPVKLGLVESLGRPGGNVTGIGSLRAELAGKRLELFKEIVPSLQRVLVTYDPREREEVQAVASAIAGDLKDQVKVAKIYAGLHPGLDPGLYVCAGSHLHVKRTVQNLASVTLGAIQLEGRAYDAEGTLLGTAKPRRINAPRLTPLAPGQKAEFDLEFLTITGLRDRAREDPGDRGDRGDAAALRRRAVSAASRAAPARPPLRGTPAPSAL